MPFVFQSIISIVLNFDFNIAISNPLIYWALIGQIKDNLDDKYARYLAIIPYLALLTSI